MQNLRLQQGFSLIEMLIVITVIVILSTVAVVSFMSARKYTADQQAKLIVDFFDEARQKALNQRKTFRVEINRTQNQVRLIDEGPNQASATDDTILKTGQLSPQVTIGDPPSNVTGAPTATTPIPVRAFTTSSYPLSNGDSKLTFRFRRNGQVVDAGTDDIGTGSMVNGATIYVRSNTPSANAPDVIRAVTILGTTGDTAIFKCKFTASSCGNWSR